MYTSSTKKLLEKMQADNNLFHQAIKRGIERFSNVQIRYERTLKCDNQDEKLTIEQVFKHEVAQVRMIVSRTIRNGRGKNLDRNAQSIEMTNCGSDNSLRRSSRKISHGIGVESDPYRYKINREIFRKRVMGERLLHNWSKNKLAKKVGYTRDCIEKLEKNGLGSEELCRKLAEVFQCSPHYLAGETDSPYTTVEKYNPNYELHDKLGTVPSKRLEILRWKNVTFDEPIKYSKIEIAPEDEEKAKCICDFLYEADLKLARERPPRSKRVVTVYTDIFYRLAYANEDDIKIFLSLWKGERTSGRYTFRKKSSPVGSYHFFRIWELANESPKLFQVLYEIANNPQKNIPKLKQILIRNYEYCEEDFSKVYEYIDLDEQRKSFN